MEYAMRLAFFLVFLPLLCFLINKRRSSKRLPPGPLGLPIIGQSLQLLKALRANKGEEWLQERARRYGPISKLSFLGTPTVFLHGQSANKFLYTSDHTTLSNQQPTSSTRLFGRKIITEVNAEDHKRLRGAFVSFLKPEALKKYVEKMDEEIRFNPDKFNPSRYEEEGAIPPYTFVAFGGGGRMCPGYEFARIGSLTMIHYLIIGFKWKLSRKDNLVSRDPLLDINKGLLIQIENKKTQGA